MRGVRIGLGLGVGVALGVLALPPFGVWPLAFAALAPLVAVVEGRSPRAAFGCAWLATSATALLVAASWLLHALVGEYRVPALSAALFIGLLVGGYALVPAAAVALYARLRPAVALAAAPALFGALFTAGEWLRAGPLGLPWLLAGHPLARAPLWIQTAELGGMHGIGLLAALCGGGLGVAFARRSARPLLLPALALAAAGAYGAARVASLAPPERALRVGVVQAALPPAERFQPGSALRNTRRHMELTRALVAEQHPELVVWSETAVDDDLDRWPALEADLQRLADETGAALLTGAPRSVGDRRFNSVVLFTPGARRPESYAKQRLVPFSEADPPFAGWLAPLLAQLTEGEAYTAGRDATVLQSGPVPLAAPVCFEISYPDLIRRFRARGAELIVNLSNDAWFGRGGYPELHFTHAVFRAVELRSWVVRGANTGVSGVIDPAGRVVERLPLFEEGVLAAEVGATRAATPYGRFGDGPLLVLLGALAAAALASGRAAPEARRRPPRARRGVSRGRRGAAAP